MKKIIIFLFFIFVFISNIKATTFYLGEKVNDMYIESIGENDMHNGAPFLLHRSDGKIVYCLNPFYMMNTTQSYKSYTYNDPIFNLTDEQLNKMNIISYYGYGYQGHTDKKWYGITQFLIWKVLNLKDIYFTDVYYGNKITKYVEEVKELESMVNNYYLVPSFGNRSYEYNPNTNYEIVDTNNVLNNYEIYESNIDAYISNNKLYINTKKSGSYIISFKRKSPVNNNYTLYNLEGAQSLLYPGKINDVMFHISIQVNSGSITINKKDSENKSRLEANLGGAIYGIYKDNKLIQKISTSKNGTAHISDLALGTYEVKELESSEGYNIDSNVYTVNLTKNSRDVSINSVSSVIKGNLVINKYYGEDENYKIDKEAIFEIYHSDKLVGTLSNINKELEYGTYIVKQTSGKKYYDLVKDFGVSILENQDYVYNLYTEKTDEIKAYEEFLSQKEEKLNAKEELLNELENELNKLKDEINKKYYELDNKKNEIKNMENNLNDQKKDLEKVKNEIKETEKMIEDQIKEIKKNKEDNEIEKEKLIKLQEELILQKQQLEEKELSINDLNQEIELKYEEIQQLENVLKEKEYSLDNKENILKELENKLNEEQKDIIEKEKNIKELENKLRQEQEEQNNKENLLIVEVPNTYKQDEKTSISTILILFGLLLIIISIKKKKSC